MPLFVLSMTKRPLPEQMGCWWWIKFGKRDWVAAQFSASKSGGGTFQGRPGETWHPSAWLHRHLAGPLTIHYVEYESQHRAAGGGVWDVHGVFPDVQPERVLIQHRLVLQQIIQGDDATCNEHTSVRVNVKRGKMLTWVIAFIVALPWSVNHRSVMCRLDSKCIHDWFILISLREQDNDQTCRLDVLHDALRHWPVIKHIRPLFCYSLVRVGQLWKFNYVVFLQDVSLRVTKNLTGGWDEQKIKKKTGS